mgnify:CR=1 FL=1
MKETFNMDIAYLSEELFKSGKNNTLLYREPENTLEVLQKIYEKANKREEFLCTFHNASLIKKPMDFFAPILKLKYGEEYEDSFKSDWFKDIINSEDVSETSRLADFCGKDEKSDNLRHKKLPLIFIEGIEELFFKMDYGHLDDDKLKNFFRRGYLEQPGHRMFGNCLRGSLPQTGNAIFFGSVRNNKGIEYATTLGNYHYMFYSGNFGNFHIKSDQEIEKMQRAQK